MEIGLPAAGHVVGSESSSSAGASTLASWPSLISARPGRRCAPATPPGVSQAYGQTSPTASGAPARRVAGRQSQPGPGPPATAAGACASRSGARRIAVAERVGDHLVGPRDPLGRSPSRGGYDRGQDPRELWPSQYRLDGQQRRAGVARPERQVRPGTARLAEELDVDALGRQVPVAQQGDRPPARASARAGRRRRVARAGIVMPSPRGMPGTSRTAPAGSSSRPPW